MHLTGGNLDGIIVAWHYISIIRSHIHMSSFVYDLFIPDMTYECCMCDHALIVHVIVHEIE